MMKPGDNNALKVREEHCDGCGVCRDVCPFGAIELNFGYPHVGEVCTLCGLCVKKCPREAIEITLERKQVKVSAASGIGVFIEHDRNVIANVSLELLGKARELAERCQYRVFAIIVGNKVDNLIETVTHYGADQTYIIKHPLLSRYSPDGYTLAVCKAVELYRPSIMLFGATPLGRDLAPRVAARLGTGLTADCTELNVLPDGELIQVRPAFGGNIMAKIVCRYHRPQMATVRPGVLKKKVREASRNRSVKQVNITIKPEEIRTRLIRRMFERTSDGINLENAEIIIAGGMGMGAKQSFGLLEEVAEALNGIVAGSRAAVDAGWLSHSRQVGQTGKAVSPKLYIACGISGAVQHLAGISGAENIISINIDPRAEIFKVSNLGIVGDVFEVLPALARELRQLAGGKAGGGSHGSD